MVAHVVNEDGQETKALPAEVIVTGTVSFSPNELRVLKVQSGMTLEAIMNDEVSAMQAMVWLALREQGYAPEWNQCGDIRGRMMQAAPDPITGGSLTTSPPSVASGE